MELTDKIKNNPHAYAIYTVLKVMRLDHVSSFTRLFKDSDELAVSKRMYAALKDVDVSCICDAYEALSEEKPKFMPNVSEIIQRAKSLDSRLKKNNAEKEAVIAKAALPKPDIINCDPIALLKKSKSGKKEKRSHDEWLKDKEEARLNNERIVASMPRRYAGIKHYCAFDGCSNAGTTSSSTAGSENWYCSKHYAMT